LNKIFSKMHEHILWNNLIDTLDLAVLFPLEQNGWS
jgi:hypothetical protein